MPNLENRLNEDRAVRDAARTVIEADLGFVKRDVHDRGLGKRVAGRVGEGSVDIAGRAFDFASRHPLMVGGGVAAIMLVLFRGLLLDLLFAWFLDREDEEEEPHEPEPAEQSPAEPERFWNRLKAKWKNLPEISE